MTVSPAAPAATNIKLRVSTSVTAEYEFTLTKATAKKLAKEFADPDIKLDEQLDDCLRSWAEYTLADEIRSGIEDHFPIHLDADGIKDGLSLASIDVDVDDVDEV